MTLQSQLNRRTVGYWASTGLLAVALLGSGVGALTQQELLVESMEHLGFPFYVMRILGTWYLSAALPNDFRLSAFRDSHFDERHLLTL